MRCLRSLFLSRFGVHPQPARRGGACSERGPGRRGEPTDASEPRTVKPNRAERNTTTYAELGVVRSGHPPAAEGRDGETRASAV